MNNIKIRIKRKIQYLFLKRHLREQRDVICQSICDNEASKTLFYLCVPSHSNLGDQAQYFCWLELFKEWYPAYSIFPIAGDLIDNRIIRVLKSKIKKHDRIFIHSGYLIFDPHPHLPKIRMVINTFKDYQITILPQTINLINKQVIALTQNSFNRHTNLTIISRDNISKINADKLFPSCRRLLMPDVVTSLIGNPKFVYECKNRNGIMFCIRNDGEKLYSDSQIDSLKSKFNGVRIDFCDTTIDIKTSEWNTNRELLIRSILKRFSLYQVIITDRYHGTIFSQIENTPVIVLSSTDHKLSSGVKWFPKDIFADNVYYANNLDEAYKQTLSVLSRNGLTKVNPPYFKNCYYSKPL